MPKTAGLTKSLTRGLTQDLFKTPPSSYTNTYSVDFDGSNDYGEVTVGSDTLNFVHSGCTLSAWVRVGEVLPLAGVYLIAGVYDYNGYFYVGMLKSGTTWKPVGYVGNKSMIGSSSLSLSDAADGRWLHVVATNGSGGRKTYVNGVSAYSSTQMTDSTKNPDGSRNFEIGRRYSTRYTDASIDEVSIHNSQLDDDAVAAMYNSGVPINLAQDSGDYAGSSSLFSWWRMGDNDGGTGSTITDATGNGRNATLHNSPTFQEVVPS